MCKDNQVSVGSSLGDCNQRSITRWDPLEDLQYQLEYQLNQVEITRKRIKLMRDNPVIAEYIRLERL